MDMLDAYRLLQQGAEVLTLVEEQGFRIDTDYCREKLAWVERKIAQSELRLKRSELGQAWLARYGEAWKSSSVPQLRSVLYADLHAKPFRYSEGGEESTSEESLRQTGVDGIEHLLRIRRYKKAHDVLKSLLRYEINGRIHPSFLLHTVQTYRSSSSGPNLQSIPMRDREIMEICRRAFIPSPGNVLLEIDFSGIEVAIAATYHQDPVMMDYLKNPESDMHGDQAREIFVLPKFNQKLKDMEGGYILRQASKNGFVFPEFYGDFYIPCSFNVACSWCKLPQNGIWKHTDGIVFNNEHIAAHLAKHDIDSLDSFTDHMEKVERDFWTKRFRVYNEWRKSWYGKYQRNGKFEMKTGFVVSGVLGKNQVINYPVQGSAFHVLLKSMIELVRRMKGWQSKVIGEIHDSMLIDANPEEVIDIVGMSHEICTVDLVRDWSWINVPMRIEIASSEIDGYWSEMKTI